MDLTRYDVKSAAEKGADLHLKNPFDNEPLMDGDKPVTITVLGRDAKAVQDARKEAEKRHAKGDIDETERGLLPLVASVVGWSGIEFDGKALDCTPENVRKVLTDPRTDWIAEQIIPFTLSRRNYSGNIASG